MPSKKFGWGHLSLIADMVGISRGRLNHILHGRRPCAGALADRLVQAAKMLEYDTTRVDWMMPEMSRNPLFLPYRGGRR